VGVGGNLWLHPIEVYIIKRKAYKRKTHTVSNYKVHVISVTELTHMQERCENMKSCSRAARALRREKRKRSAGDVPSSLRGPDAAFLEGSDAICTEGERSE